LVQISDLHYGTYIKQKRLEVLVSTVNQLEPDAIVFTGDLVSNSPEKYSPALVESLGKLRPKIDVLAVRGNHDHWTDADQIAEIFDKCGFIHLENSIYSLLRGENQLHFVGLDCHYEGKDRLDCVLEALPDRGAAILLIHEPDYADLSAASHRFDVQLSGHSHGGQVVFPGVGPLFLPKYAKKYPLGLYRSNGMLHYTNRGIGTSHLRLRINCPAEISVFTLHPVG
jgi:predicted MPP superfamily phosphohydrolase